MLNLRALIGRKPAPTKGAKPPTSRLVDMVEADRAATGSKRIDLIHAPRNKDRRIGEGVVREGKRPAIVERNKTAAQAARRVSGQATAPSNIAPVKAKAKPTNTPTKAALRQIERQPPSSKSVEKKPVAAPVAPEIQAPVPKVKVNPVSLDVMEVTTERLLARMEVGSLERFRQYARSKKMLIRQNKERTLFLNEDTQKAWEVWKEAETQCHAQVVGAFKEQIAHTLAVVQNVESRPISNSGFENAVSDMTIIIKRLAFTLNRTGSASKLPALAMDYLKRHNLLDTGVGK